MGPQAPIWTASFLILLGFFCTGVLSVKITRLDVPSVIKNGSDIPAVLDCDFSYDENERDGIVVNWYFNSDLETIYQWIPSKKPQDLGILKGRLNLDYNASGDYYTRHRALQIRRPTTDLTGVYKCKVGSLEGGEDFMQKRMIVYASERRLELTHHKPSAGTVNVTCVAEGVFPEPRLYLSKSPGKNNSQRITAVTYEKTLQDGAYEVIVAAILNDSDLEAETVFQCELSIPETNYIVSRATIYNPEGSNIVDDSGAAASASGSWLWTVVIAAVLRLRL